MSNNACAARQQSICAAAAMKQVVITVMLMLLTAFGTAVFTIAYKNVIQQQAEEDRLYHSKVKKNFDKITSMLNGLEDHAQAPGQNERSPAARTPPETT